MKIIADLHAHTLVSNHAFNTITEMAKQAAELGHFALAITDHGPLMPDSPHPWYFYNITTLPRKMEGVWVLKGIEANVCDVKGTLDFDESKFEELDLDWVVASIHPDTLPGPLTQDQATELWINVANNPRVDMIGHSESRFYAYDYDAVTKIFAQKKKVVELNANSRVARPGNEVNMRDLALACKKNDVPVAINSDAHSIYHLGQVDTIFEMLQEIHFPNELIVNTSEEKLKRMLAQHHKKVLEYMEELK